MAREPIPAFVFVLVVVQKGDQFLVLQERAHSQLWYLPAGRVEPGESLEKAAIRETLEETAVPVELTGILRVEYSPAPNYSRMRVIFVARPVDDTPPLSELNEHALQARWVTIDELRALPLRGMDVISIFQGVQRGAPIAPLSLLSEENAPFKYSD